MRVIIQPSHEMVARWAARYVAKAIATSAPTREKPFVLGLPTGSSPVGMYDQLVELHEKGKVSFANVVTFNMDEYVGLAADHPASYHAFMWKHLFGRIDIPKDNVNILDGKASDLSDECAAYEQRIRRAGGVDLFVGGIGPDGHIAFNEPGSSLASRTRAKSLTQDTVVANARFFNGDVSQVPKMALTVGVGTVMEAREVLIIATGYNKARALRHAIEEGVNHMWTISALQMHPQGIIVCDDDATMELRVGTVKYFKVVEGPNLEPSPS